MRSLKARTSAAEMRGQRVPDWVRDKVEIRTIKEADLLDGKMYRIDNAGLDAWAVWHTDFTTVAPGRDTPSSAPQAIACTTP